MNLKLKAKDQDEIYYHLKLNHELQGFRYNVGNCENFDKVEESSFLPSFEPDQIHDINDKVQSYLDQVKQIIFHF